LSKADSTPENERICRDFCGTCPTFPDTGELLFCARGKSSSPKKEMGCNCGVCDVWNKYSLKDFYYCIKVSSEQ